MAVVGHSLSIRRSRFLNRTHLLLALSFSLVALFPGLSFAGSGTSADPWRTLNIFYTWSNNSGPSSTYQDITADQAHTSYVEFWAYAQNLSSGKQSYLGMQTMGTLKGYQNGLQVSKSVHFSLFGNGNPIANLQPQYCTSGADGGTGLSCAQSFAWTVGTTYRFQVYYYYGITTPGWCSSGLSSCTVAQGLIGSTQIAAFSYSPFAYGIMQAANSFLELPLNTGGTCSAPVPEGTYVVPFKTISGVTSSVISATSFDRTDTVYPQTCARTYNEWVVTRIHY